MEILVLSDSHGKIDHVLDLIQSLDLDLIIHLGDYSQDVDLLRKHTRLPIENIRGNCDYADKNTLEEKILDIEGKKIFISHGHRYDVKNSYNKIYYRGLELGVDLVLFGHSHRPYLEKDEKIILFNPGSISLPKMGNVGTYGLVKIENNEITINVKNFKEISKKC